MKHFLPAMTSVEAAEAVTRGAVALLPIGTVEANGPHLPLGYDYIVSEALARRVAERTGDVWLPPITYGVSEVLSAFPGTLFVRPEVLSAHVEDILRSLIKHGFDHIVILNNHIPNQQPVEDACRRVRRATGVLVASIYPAALAKDLTKDIYADEVGTIGHGADPGTSMMLHLCGDDVRMDLARPSEIKSFQGFEVLSPFAVRHASSQVHLYLDLDELTDIGGWADPTKATAEKGELIVGRMVDFVASFVERFRTIDTRSSGRSSGVSAAATATAGRG